MSLRLLTHAGGAQMSPYCHLSSLGLGPQIAGWGLTWLSGREALTSYSGSAASHCAGKDWEHRTDSW